MNIGINYIAQSVHLRYIYTVNKCFNLYIMSFALRLKKARNDKGLSQTELAKLVGIHYTQIGRYETKGAQPAADILSKLANALGVSSDFLTNGTSDDLAESSLADKELLNQFKAIEKMNNNDKNVIKTLIDAFITKGKIKQLAL
jgi:transcriptional regulator with XRE-family HTH domain